MSKKVISVRCNKGNDERSVRYNENTQKGLVHLFFHLKFPYFFLLLCILPATTLIQAGIISLLDFHKSLQNCLPAFTHGPLCSYSGLLKMTMWDFPGGPVAKNLTANAGDVFDHWSGKIPHAAERLSPCTATVEACSPTACALQ